jgi:hypothetical protein
MAISIIPVQSGFQTRTFLGGGYSNIPLDETFGSPLLLQNPLDTQVVVTPPAGPFVIGQAITVPVTINTVPNTRGAQFGLSFNPAVLRCDSVDEGTFYSDWASLHNGLSTVFPSATCNNTTGTISVAGVFIITNDLGGPNGSGAIFNYHFTVLADGISPLTLTSTEIVDDNTNNIQKLPITVVNSQITVGNVTNPPTYTPTPANPATPTNTSAPNSCANSDVNQDGVVSVGDLTAVGQRMGETGTPGWIREDVNRDGMVSVGDFVEMGICFGRTITPSVNTSTPTATATGAAPSPTSTSTATPNPLATSTWTPTPTATSNALATSTPTASMTPTVTATLSTDAQVNVDPASQTVFVNQQFETNILVTTLKPSRGAQIGISFDPAVLKCNSLTKGVFYSNWAAANGATANLFPAPIINNTTGKISPTAYFITGGTTGPTGTATLFVLKCTPLTTGTSPITLTNVEVNDDDPTGNGAGKLSITIVNGSVNAVTGQNTNTPTVTSTNTNPPKTATRTLTPNPQVNTPTKTSTPDSGGGLGAVPTVSDQYKNTLPTMQSSSRMGFSPAQQILPAPGATFTVDVVIKGADKPIRGIMANIKYDPKIIECSSVDEGNFLSDWAGKNGGSSMLFPSPDIDNVAGTIANGAQIIIDAQTGPESAQGGATGDGSFLKLSCKAKAIGVSKLTLDTVELAGDNAQGTTYKNKVGVALESGEVFVGVTPTVTPLGGSGTQSANSSGSTTLTPAVTAGGTGVAGTALPTPGIANISNAIIIPVTSGEGGQTIGDITNFIDEKAIITADVLLRSSDGLIAFLIPKGAQALTKENYPVKQITIECLDPAPEDVDIKGLIGCVIEIQPDGSTFNPPANLIIAVDFSSLPKGVSIDQLTIVNYDTVSKKWISLPSIVDKEAGTVSAQISHFSLYSMKAKSNLWGWLWFVLLLIILVAGIGIYYLKVKNRRVVVEGGRIRLLYAPVDSIGTSTEAGEEITEAVEIIEIDHQSNPGENETK